MSEWRDISTAPKDGTRILTLCEGAACPIMVGNWLDRDPGDDDCYTGSWRDDGDEPTHRMPLPEPPTDTGEAA